jgi:hypothetical protein
MGRRCMCLFEYESDKCSLSKTLSRLASLSLHASERRVLLSAGFDGSMVLQLGFSFRPSQFHYTKALATAMMGKQIKVQAQQ